MLQSANAMLRQSYVSIPHLDLERSLTYAFGKNNAVIIADIDHNGFLDLVTFPSNFEVATPLSPLPWLNQGGEFTATSAAIKNPGIYQYFRDSVAGDFNGDGYVDYFQIDQGWELNNRDPNFFFGSQPALLLGGSTGLTWQTTESWLTNQGGGQSFNHIADAADYDGDGDLDMVIGSFWDFRIYQNKGNGVFTWREDTLPSKFNSQNGSWDVSGTTFIDLGGKYAVIAGAYRIWDASMTAQPLSVLIQKNGLFEEAYTLARPNLGFLRERNFGASDMFNMDLNGDGREDLLVIWETEPLNGINDGLSNMSGNPKAQRYQDISNTVVSLYFQDDTGRLVEDKVFYNGPGNTNGAPLYFEDFNLDGYVDFWFSHYHAHPSNFDELVFINDGTGQFSNPKNMFSTMVEYPAWNTMSPFFFDANNDGAIDVVGVKAVFPNPPTRNIGEEIHTFLSDRPAYDIKSNNKFLAVLADKNFDGGAGIDTGVFSGSRSSYTVSSSSNGVWSTVDKVVGRDGKDNFVNVERLQFTDTNLALDVGPTQNAGSVYMLYKAAFNRTPDAVGMGYWIAQKDGGANIVTSIAQGFVNSAEFIAKYGANPTNASYVNNLYQNVLGRAGEAGGVAYWTGEMDAGRVSKAQALVQFATLPEGASLVAPLIANGIQYQEWVG
jgi:hypothetical protein